MKTLKTLGAVAALLIGTSAAYAENNAIQSINTSTSGNEIVIRVDLKTPPASAPTGFAISKPARIAFDFPETINNLGHNSIQFNQSDLTGASVIQAGDRTRLVLNLLRNLNFDTRIEGNSLLITLTPLAPLSNDSKSSRFAEASPVIQKHSVQDITFRRGKDGEGRIIVDLGDNGTGIDIRQQGAALAVLFQKTSAGESLLRKMDVTDFATPVTSITTTSQGDNIRMMIQPKGLWEHYAYQTDNKFVIEVRPITENPNKLVQGSKLGYQGPRVSINYQNGDVRALLRLMAEELNLNAVISETVTGTTTLVLKDVPADQVIDIIFQQKGLDMRKNGNVILIAPRDEISVREKLEYESKQQIGDLEPLAMEAIQLNYQKAADVQKLLSGDAGKTLLSKRGKVTADTVTNNIFVNDTPSKIEELRKFVKIIDISNKQVLIEARVVEANDNFNRSLGMKLGLLNSRAVTIGKGINTDGNAGTTINVGGGSYTASGQSSSKTIGVNLPSYSNSSGGTIALSLFNASLSRILNIELSAMESDGVGKIISSPRVITSNNVKAKIEDGSEIPIVTPGTANSPPTVSFKSAKLSLEATPQITPDGTINMQLVVKKEEPDWTKAVSGNPPIKSSIVETSAVVENGGTVVIGGVFVVSDQNSVEKVPVLGDIPVLGWMFKNRVDQSTRRELLVFITPRIISDKLRLD